MNITIRSGIEKQEIGQMLLNLTDDGEGGYIPGAPYVPEDQKEAFAARISTELKRRLRAGFLILAALFPGPAAQAWDSIVIHISASTHMTQDECNQWHRERGWKDCGYNFVVEPDGTIYEARGWDRIGAHTKGQNSRRLGFCFVTKDCANEEQIKAFIAWLGQAESLFGRLTVHPHREFARKDCPGNVWHQLMTYFTQDQGVITAVSAVRG